MALSENDLRILEILAQQEEKLSGHKIRTSYSSISVIRRLMRMKLVKIFGEYVSEKGATAKIYGPTLYGLATVMWKRELWNYTDKIVDRWKDLDPLVFGNWDILKGTFQKEKVEEALREAFFVVFSTLNSWYGEDSSIKDFIKQSFPTNTFKGSDDEVHKKIFEYAFFAFLFRYCLTDEKSIEPLASKVRSLPPHVKASVVSYLQDRIAFLSYYGIHFERLKKLNGLLEQS